MKKILFIIPPCVNFSSFINPAFNERSVAKKMGNYGSVVTDMPLGPLSLSAYLKKNTKAEIKLIDFNIELNKTESFNYNSFSEWFHEFLSAKEWVDFAPTIIGISTLFSPAYYNMMDIGKVARSIFPNALITAGGGIPTNIYEKIYSSTNCFDALCFGEGEKPLLELVNAVDKNELLKNHSSWITKEKVEKKQFFEHCFIENLDEIPFLDYDILNIDDYRLNYALSLYPLEKERNRKGISIMTSRGCPHRCCFCSSHTVHGRKMRYYSIERIKEDFKRLCEQYDVETLIFYDDHLLADKRRAHEIFDVIRSLQMTAFFPSSLALYALDRKMLEDLKSIGVVNLPLAVESGSERVLREVMHKPLNLSIVQRVVDDCRDLGIATDSFILIGLPGETKQDIEDARNFLKTLKGSWFKIHIATPLVGTEMLEICIKKNYLRGDYMDCDFKRPIVETEDFTPEYIKEKAYLLNLELNFVENSDLRLGNYDLALKGFENAIRVKNDHAFAFYYASKCYEKLGEPEKAEECLNTAKKIVFENPFWREYADMFKIPI